MDYKSLNPKRCLTRECCEVAPEMEHKLWSCFSNFDQVIWSHLVIEFKLVRTGSAGQGKSIGFSIQQMWSEYKITTNVILALSFANYASWRK